MQIRSFLAAAMVACCLSLPAALVAQTVNTEGGRLEGVRSGRIVAYKGIPYATPPVGSLRWREPQPASPWKGVRKASTFAPICMQTGEPLPGAPAERVSEDCLYLNIWAPIRSGAKRNEALPVMVWLYGGGWTNGSSSTPVTWGDRLAAKDVIVVSLNYRGGAFGFLAHPELTRESGRGASGNYGLMDQIAALRWVQRNISSFGGDPKRVTLFGQSAGSMSASLLMTSPLAKGLFHQVIGQSGGVFIPPEASPAGASFLLNGAERAGVQLATALGARDLAAMRALPASVILAQQKRGADHFILDGHVLPREPYEVFSTGQQHQIPVLLGWNADEGTSFFDGRTVRGATFAADLRRDFGTLPAPLLAAYPATSDAQARASRAELERDLRFGYEMWTWARLQAKSGKGKAFVYNFAQVPPYPAGSRFAEWGAGHGTELRYVFGHLQQEPWAWTANDRKLSDAMATYWTNFAKRGDPNGAGLPSWPAFDGDKEQVLQLRVPITIAGVTNRRALGVIDAIFSHVRASRSAAKAK
jgi:para-nitrobenzyl esterase